MNVSIKSRNHLYTHRTISIGWAFSIWVMDTTQRHPHLHSVFIHFHLLLLFHISTSIAFIMLLSPSLLLALTQDIHTKWHINTCIHTSKSKWFSLHFSFNFRLLCHYLFGQGKCMHAGHSAHNVISLFCCNDTMDENSWSESSSGSIFNCCTMLTYFWLPKSKNGFHQEMETENNKLFTCGRARVRLQTNLRDHEYAVHHPSAFMLWRCTLLYSNQTIAMIYQKRVQ